MEIKDIYSKYLQCTQVCTDTRQLSKGCFFVCIKGDNFDGNTFAKDALEQGASFVLIDNKDYQIDERTILVDNTIDTLQALAKYHRSQLVIPVIGITGTNGKTTTKELLTAVLSRKYRVWSTKGNLNNHIGVPLTLLSIDKATTQIAIVEMGANHRGEIAQLCAIAQPNYGVITNIGKAHIEGFGSVEGIIETKSALYKAVQNVDGTVFVNADDALLMKLSEEITRLTYGTSKQADVCGKCNEKTMYMTFKLPQFNRTISTQLTGSYNFNNAMAAVAAGLHFDVDMEDIVYALISYLPTNNRSQVEMINGQTIIVDAYNANPSSMAVAIDNLDHLKAEHKVVILGMMKELGEDSLKEHAKIIERLKNSSIEQKFLLGDDFCQVSDDKSIVYDNFEDMAKAIKADLLPGSTILLKGSRSMKIERVLDLLKSE
ncbi:MAG: UDP-N-acetylmuramoyl-tripeptide--D-alanyl-D-alanine ligase [Bacteroidales bacterium]|nr:UDP-N-acetylmuramoyl-tripeptide--D-alanyl-D-alanine ligase [Bacteroidales bacterium]